jgi:V8-like Glu-specific endopeptidase
MLKTAKCLECILLLCLLAELVPNNLPPSLLAVSAQQQDDYPEPSSIVPLCESLIPYFYDSGNDSALNDNATTNNLTAAVVSHPGAPWIQLDLSRTRLSSSARLILRGEASTQELDAHALAYASNGYSAVFSGDAVSVELAVVRPPAGGRRRRHLSGEATSRIVVSNILVGLCDPVAGVESICFTEDDRVPSRDVRQGRIGLGGSCTAWLVSESVFVTAGHCGNATERSRMHFTFDAGPANSEDQYAVELSTYVRVYEGALDDPDWAVGRLLPNAVTKLLPGVARGGWYNISTSAAAWSVGRTVRITGYGTDDDPLRKLTQQTHAGTITGVATNYLRYNADSMVSR